MSTLDDAKNYIDLPKRMQDENALVFARAVVTLYGVIDRLKAPIHAQQPLKTSAENGEQDSLAAAYCSQTTTASALGAPAPRMDHSKVLEGIITEFNETTWWGRVYYDLTTLEFHGSCYRGLSANNLPKVGQKVTIILNRVGNTTSIEARR